MANPEFRMKGVSFVISSTTNTGHPLPFRIRLRSGKWAEIQHSLRESMDVIEVAEELYLLADNLLQTARGTSPFDHLPPGPERELAIIAGMRESLRQRIAESQARAATDQVSLP